MEAARTKGGSFSDFSINGRRNLYRNYEITGSRRLKQISAIENKLNTVTASSQNRELAKLEFSTVIHNPGAAGGGMQINPLVEKWQNNVLLDWGAAGGSEGVSAQLAGMQMNQLVFPFAEVLKVIKREFRDYGWGATGGGEHVSFFGKGWEADELARGINVLLNHCAGRGKEGGIAHWYYLDGLARWIEIMLNRGAARGGEGGIAHLTSCEVVDLVMRIHLQLDRGAVGGGEGGTSHLAGMQLDPLFSFLGENFEVLIREMQAYGVGTAHLGMQINPYISSFCQGWEADELAKLIKVIHNRSAATGNEVGTDHLAVPQFNLLPDSMPLNMSTSPAGFAPGASRPWNRAAESHSIRIYGEPQSTDSVIQDPNNKILEWSSALGFSLYATAVQATALMPKYYSRTILGLLATSLTCLFCNGVFYKKLPAKFVNLATYLAIACNASALLLLVGFFFAKM